MDNYEAVYKTHCIDCPLKYTPNCYYKNCSLSQYTKWLNEANKNTVVLGDIIEITEISSND